jgi:hypothetical protein
MIHKEFNRMQFLAGLITEAQYLSEFRFHDSPDEDTPGNKQVVVFRDDDKYTLQGNTHGELSHAVKHFGEFDPNMLSSVLNNIIEYIKKTQNPILKNINGNNIASGDAAKKQLTPNAVLNTLDFINDKTLNNQQLTPEEKEIKDTFLDKLNTGYNKLVQNYLTSGVDVDNMGQEEVKQMLSTNKKIKFTGSYKGNKFEYVFDPSTTGILAKQGDTVSTLFRIDKKGNDLNKVSGYFSRGVELTNPELSKALNIQQ